MENKRIVVKIGNMTIKRKLRRQRHIKRSKFWRDHTNIIQLSNEYQFRWGKVKFSFRIFNPEIIKIFKKLKNRSKFIRTMLIEKGFTPDTLAQEPNLSKTINNILVDKLKGV